MAKIIKINSNKNVFVFGSNYSQNTPTDGQKINLNTSTWTNTRVLIQQGIHTYPAEIADWRTVKALEQSGVITITAPSDGLPENADDEKAVAAVAKAKKLEKEEKATTAKTKARKQKLEELADRAVEKQYEDALNEEEGK